MVHADDPFMGNAHAISISCRLTVQPYMHIGSMCTITSGSTTVRSIFFLAATGHSLARYSVVGHSHQSRAEGSLLVCRVMWSR
jgi:hypothetical protein